MAKIYLDPGHGGTDPGAVANGLKEKDLTLSIAKHARKYLQDNYEDVSVRMSRTTDKTVSLAARTNDANKWGADALVSIHINAGGGVGYEDFVYNRLSTSSNTPKLQDAIHKEVAPLFKTNRGQKRANFHMLRESRASAVLTENGFIDNKSDADFLRKNSNLKKIGEAHAKGIAKYLGLKRKSNSEPPSNDNGGLYYVQIGAFSKKSNADSLTARAKRSGFDAFVKQEGGLYKVQLGAFGSKKNADSLAARAKRSGYNVYIAE